MQWADVLKDPHLRNLPYKIELNEWGQIVMSPASNRHRYYQGEIIWQMRQKLGHGHVFPECSIETPKGTKVADVVWCSETFIRKHGYETPYTEVPEICIEIVSPSNNPAEMEEKRKLYFSKGAQEVWIIAEGGDVALYDAQGRIPESRFGVGLNLSGI